MLCLYEINDFKKIHVIRWWYTPWIFTCYDFLSHFTWLFNLLNFLSVPFAFVTELLFCWIFYLNCYWNVYCLKSGCIGCLKPYIITNFIILVMGILISLKNEQFLIDIFLNNSCTCTVTPQAKTSKNFNVLDFHVPIAAKTKWLSFTQIFSLKPI